MQIKINHRVIKGFALTLLLVACAVDSIKTHVLREKTNLHNLLDKSSVSFISRAEKKSLHTVIFAVMPLHMDELTSLLHDVSNPSSKNYGKHLTKKEVADFTANPSGYAATMQYLKAKENLGLSIVKESPYGEYITATAPVHVWEETFATSFHVYEVKVHLNSDGHGNKKKTHTTTVIRAEEYSLPAELDGHVSAVFNTVQFPPQNLLHKHMHHPTEVVVDAQTTGTTTSSSSSSSSSSTTTTTTTTATTTATTTQSSGIISGTVTPALINQYYNVTNNKISSTATQAVYEGLNQSYSPSDLTLFQQYFNLEQNPISQDIGGHAFNAACLSENGNNCIEANLDVQYIMGIAESVDTIYDYSDVDTIDWMLSWITTVATSPNPAQVYSISYSSYEAELTQSYAASFNTEAIKLGSMGTTILAASGDDGVAGFIARNDSYYCGYSPQFPSTSPYVVSVGGTNGPQLGEPEISCQSGGSVLITTGGGFSNLYSLPSWQSSYVNGYFNIVNGTSEQPYTTTNDVEFDYYGQYITANIGTFNSKGRGYPDVSLLAHSYLVMINGSLGAVDGTSASTPTMAAFVSLVNAERLQQGMSTMGWLNPFLYQYSSQFAYDITSGYNKCTALFRAYPGGPRTSTCCKEGFNATKGWDPVTGLGSVDYESFLSAALSVSSSSSSPAASNNLSAGAIAGIVIAVTIAVALIAGVLYYLWNLHKGRPDDEDIDFDKTSFSGHASNPIFE